MQERSGHKVADTGLTGRERNAIEEFLAYIEDRVKNSEPICATLVRQARLALTAPHAVRHRADNLH